MKFKFLVKVQSRGDGAYTDFAEPILVTINSRKALKVSDVRYKVKQYCYDNYLVAVKTTLVEMEFD
jgi:hypothetical protein